MKHGDEEGEQGDADKEQTRWGSWPSSKGIGMRAYRGTGGGRGLREKGGGCVLGTRRRVRRKDLDIRCRDLRKGGRGEGEENVTGEIDELFMGGWDAPRSETKGYSPLGATCYFVFVFYFKTPSFSDLIFSGKSIFAPNGTTVIIQLK